jgi:hypothetical protein
VNNITKLGESQIMDKRDIYLVTAFRSLGEIINHKDTEISVLNYEITRLKEELERRGKDEKGS